jgi:hypothetical protein
MRERVLLAGERKAVPHGLLGTISPMVLGLSPVTGCAQVSLGWGSRVAESGQCCTGVESMELLHPLG